MLRKVYCQFCYDMLTGCVKKVTWQSTMTIQELYYYKLTFFDIILDIKSYICKGNFASNFNTPPLASDQLNVVQN